MTRQSFGQPGVTDYRNPYLAEAMMNLGLEKNGNPPLAFQVENSHVLAVLEPRQ